ncbi:MAG: molybdopterin molybdotransferase MoeA [Oscillospiraceae bacterium]|nr:molybdopterin molybdotransferase MoeA [Oscillospiraceae bacterium]
MLTNPDFNTARRLLMDAAAPVGTEETDISACPGRILAESIVASENVPPFDRSPYDGYAFRSADSVNASRENPVTLRILEEVPAGAVPTMTVTPGTATKILTGAPIPEGADAVTQFERTEFTAETVTLFSPAKPGENIVVIGEDVKKGAVLAEGGVRIDPGVAGTLAAQGIARPRVYRVPRVGILSTGNEVVEVGETLGAGKIYNSNRYTLSAALRDIGCEPVSLGLAGDTVEGICELIRKGLETCDAVISTGGVSVGDYDLTPDAMERAGVTILFRGTDIKPGMACAYGVKDGKLVCGLSGNPASSLTNFCAVAVPALRKLTGLADYAPKTIKVTLRNGFKKKSPTTRLLRGTLDFSDGCVKMDIPKDQGNVVLSSVIGCNAMAIVPAGSGPVAADTVLEGFIL